jgi:hypothetical protein
LCYQMLPNVEAQGMLNSRTVTLDAGNRIPFRFL